MFTQTIAATSGFNSDEFHSLVLNELKKNANRIRAATNAGDDSGRQLTFSLKNLGARFSSGYLVKIAHHCWIRVRSQYAAEQIMSCTNVRHPIAHGLIDCVFQGARARLHTSYLR